ncbi:MAG: G5 domain-containing protein [Chloroflexi bacterium]|nr:G5 domain-containing protein [Chloroflexota bacterium]
MPDRRPAAPHSSPRPPQRNTDPHRWIANLRNGRFHLALTVTLAASLLIALGVPIARTRASTQEPPTQPALVAGEGLVAALNAQAETVVAALAEAGSPPLAQDTALAAASQSGRGGHLIPPSLLAAVGRIAARGVLTSPRGDASLLMQRQQAVPFTVHEDGFAFNQLSSHLTVGQALAGLGIALGPADILSPRSTAPLSAGLHVYIQRASRIDLRVGGQQRTVYTHAATAGDVLAEAGVALQPLDRVSPSVDSPVRQSMAVDVTIVRAAAEYVVEAIPFSTIYQDDADLLQGDEMLVQAGSNGYIRKEYRVVYENGVEVSREQTGETVELPVDQIIAEGTAIAYPVYVASVPAAGPGPGCAYTMTVYATWYTSASAGGFGRTATGTEVYKGIVAVDPSVIPLGTQMYIPGYGYGLAADTGGGIIGHMIDLAYGDYDVYDWSTRWVDICILG